MKRIKQKNILTRSVHSLTDREDKEFAHTRDNMRYLNSSQRGAPLVSLFGMCLSGALSVGAMKVIEKLAMIKYPTPPTEDNPCGTLSYLPARAQWAELQILKIQRTMVDAGAIPLKSGIAVCSANAPRQLPTAHAVEAGEAGPAVFRKYLDRSLHLLLQWMRRLTLRFSILLLFLMTEPSHSQLQIFLLFFMTASGPLQKIQATVWKMMQDLSWKMIIIIRWKMIIMT